MTRTDQEWLALGDSITQDAFAVDLAWRETLGADGPVPVNAGVRGDTLSGALARLDPLLTAHPRARYVGVAFGTNDVYGRISLEVFTERLRELVSRIRRAGKVPVLATIPYSTETELARLPAFNQAIKALEAELALPAGPDLYALTAQHEDYLAPDGVHMTPAGSQAIQRAWAEAAAPLAK